MDPQQTLIDILEAFHNMEPFEALTKMDALHDWIRNGGFLPTVHIDQITHNHSSILPTRVYLIPKETN